jgi:hypothetical protein
MYMDTCERLGKGIAEYARSMIYVAKYYVNIGGLADLDMALELLRRLANSNAEENQLAKDALPKLESARATLAKARHK